MLVEIYIVIFLVALLFLILYIQAPTEKIDPIQGNIKKEKPLIYPALACLLFFWLSLNAIELDEKFCYTDKVILEEYTYNNITATNFNDGHQDNVTLLGITVGSIVSGSIDNTTLDDDVYLVLGENNTNPSFDYRINITNSLAQGNPIRIAFNGRYDGNSAHNVEWYIYCFGTQTWNIIQTIPDSGSTDIDYEHTVNVADFPHMIFDDGTNETMMFRFLHKGSGNTNHELYIDQFVSFQQDGNTIITNDLDVDEINTTETNTAICVTDAEQDISLILFMRLMGLLSFIIAVVGIAEGLAGSGKND